MSGNFVAKLTGPDGLVDRKLFGHRADAIRYVQGEGLENIEAYCDTCQQNTMNWREYERLYGIFSLKTKPLLRCSECYKVRPDNAPRP
jgi:hypothetical protein